jgi:hypothetical protein
MKEIERGETSEGKFETTTHLGRPMRSSAEVNTLKTNKIIVLPDIIQ